MSRKKKDSKFLIIILLILIVIAGVLLAYKILSDKPETQTVFNDNIIENAVDVVIEEPKVVKEIQTFKGNDRPIAVMIDNHTDARPQVGVNNAYMVYEIIVEGGITRMMAVFKGVDLEEIGPIRSARHYFLDYALENDAIYVHYGASPQALSDISGLNVSAINGIYQSASDFWRTNSKAAPHNVLSSTKNILKIATEKKYSTVSTKKSVLNYTVDEINLDDGINADNIYIPFSTSQNVSFEYDTERQIYIKSANGKKQADWVTKEDISFKNIIITFVQNYDLNDASEKGRQGLNNVKTLDGYYITNGKAIKIKCEKTSRGTQTVYRDLQGNEIEVNDGNTYLGLCPIDAKVTIESNEIVEEGEALNE